MACTQAWKAGSFYTKRLVLCNTGTPITVSGITIDNPQITEVGEDFLGSYLAKHYDITYTAHIDEESFSDVSIASVGFRIIQERTTNDFPNVDEQFTVSRNENGSFSYTLKDVHIPLYDVYDWGGIPVQSKTEYHYIKVSALIVTNSGQVYYSAEHTDTWSWERIYEDWGEPEEW